MVTKPKTYTPLAAPYSLREETILDRREFAPGMVGYQPIGTRVTLELDLADAAAFKAFVAHQTVAADLAQKVGFLQKELGSLATIEEFLATALGRLQYDTTRAAAEQTPPLTWEDESERTLIWQAWWRIKSILEAFERDAEVTAFQEAVSRFARAACLLVNNEGFAAYFALAGDDEVADLFRNAQEEFRRLRNCAGPYYW